MGDMGEKATKHLELASKTPLTKTQIRKRLAALADYSMSMLRINEQSDAADREYLRVMEVEGKLRSMLKDAPDD